MPNIYIETLGCKTNQYESSYIIDNFIENGYNVTDDIKTADIIVINTCSVTNRTDYKSRYLINKAREIKEKNPSIKVAITGCYSQKNKNELLKSGFIDLIADNNSKHKIYEYLHQPEAKIVDFEFLEAEYFTDFPDMEIMQIPNRNRATIKIQDGCDFDCTYCIVPSVRGNPRNRSYQKIESQLQILLENGYQEIILAGINLGLFPDLPNLLYKLADFQRLQSIRLSSIEPNLFSEQLLQAIKKIDKICPHFHIPLQSGSDTILKKHKRRYSIATFTSLIKTLHEITLYPAIGFDIIVGLPGESDELFEETFSLLKNLDFTYLHVFIYSKRKGTPASLMDSQIHGSIAKERSRKLLDLSNHKKKEYIIKLISYQVELLTIIEGFDQKTKLYYGTSNRYIKCYFREFSAASYSHKSIFLYPKKLYSDGVLCEIRK